MPQVAGLIGFPVAHSISTIFQQAAFDALGIDARYERWATTAIELPARIAALRSPAYLGANVTSPHKERVLDLLDEVEPVARRVGAVNTIVNTGGTLQGANTDVEGFTRALRERGGFDPRGAAALLLGAGGAARAVVVALAEAGAARILVANRHPERAIRLVSDLEPASSSRIEALRWSDAVSAAGLRSVELLIHCTTLGLAGSELAAEAPVSAAALHRNLFVCDIVANPLVTPLLRLARAAGARCLGGLPMLVYQGAAAFERWTRRSAPVELMMQAAEAAMRSSVASGQE